MLSLISVAMFGVVNFMAGTWMLADATPNSGGATVSVVLTGVGATTVIGVMAWIVKKVVSGEMVPLPIRQLTEELVQNKTRQDQLINDLLSERLETRDLVKASTEAQFAIRDWLRMNVGSFVPEARNPTPSS